LVNQWTTAVDLKKQLLRYWERGEILRSRLQEEPLFPLKLRLRRPTSSELATHFDEVRLWISQFSRLEGYDIQWKEIRHHIHGRNSLPQAVYVADEPTALKLIGKSRQAAIFQELSNTTLQAFPELKSWLIKRPRRVLQHAGHWQQILQVLSYFQQHPGSGLYLRQLDIAGVDTKFIEQHRGLLSGMLDITLHEDIVNSDATGVKGFNRRYGLKDEPALIRFRLLDAQQFLHGMSDISIPADQFAELNPPASSVFITENKINGLAFPQIADALVIFGLGYGLERLKECDWLRNKKIVYWGDIDTHGFRILDQLRKSFPRASSLLMDTHTLMEHRPLWVQEKPNQRSMIELPRLTLEEQQLYDDLRYDRIAEAIRLEQERIPFGWVNKILNSCSEMQTVSIR
jgi:hypothetical protein